MSGLWIGYGGRNHRHGSIPALDLKVLTAFWGIFIFLFSVRIRVVLECGKPSHFNSVGRMNSGQRWESDAHAEARRTRRKKSCRILTERLNPQVCLMMFTNRTSQNISAPSKPSAGTNSRYEHQRIHRRRRRPRMVWGAMSRCSKPHPDPLLKKRGRRASPSGG
jgi:hypothetical protein